MIKGRFLIWGFVSALFCVVGGYASAKDSVIAERCVIVMKELNRSFGHQEFLEAIQAEPDEEVRKYALIIYDDVRRHGMMTEVGAHGHNLSWKWLGVFTEKKDGEADKHKVVGYANFQHYMAPYAELARAGKVAEIAVGSNYNGEVFIDGKEFLKLPLATRQKIVRAIHLALKPDRVRVFQPAEKDQLWRDGTLPVVHGALSMVGGSEPGAAVSMLSLCPGANSVADVGRVEFRLDPTQPIIIGKMAEGIPPYLDPNYRPTNVSPGGQPLMGRAGDKHVSRAHFMLQAEVGQGIWIVNGVPSSETPGDIRAPTNNTWITEPGKPERAMDPKERFLVKNGSYAIIRLPNGARMRIDSNGQ